MITRSPIFIGGLFKSGTTLLRSLIGQHSRIASGLETYWFDLDWNAKKTARFAERVKWLATFYSVSPESLESYLSEASAEAFLDQLLSGFARAQSKARWAEKTPGNIVHMDRILTAWPQAKIVHIIRDPRDVFASLRQSRKWDSIEEFMARWTLYLGSAEGFKQRIDLSPERYLEIRYEDLAVQPDTTMRTVIDFVGEPWEPAVGRLQVNVEEHDFVRKVTGKVSTTLKRLGDPISANRVAIWKDTLDPAEIEAIHREADNQGLGDLMRRLERETTAG